MLQCEHKESALSPMILTHVKPFDNKEIQASQNAFPARIIMSFNKKFFRMHILCAKNMQQLHKNSR